MTYTFSDRPSTKEELATELKIWPSALYELQKIFYIYVDDFGERYKGKNTLDDYQEWLFRQFTQPSYLMEGKTKDKHRLNQNKIKRELSENATKYSLQAFHETRKIGEKGKNETARVIKFNFIKRQRI